MLTVGHKNALVHAMVMKDPADRCLGVVQCGLPGCEAYMALVEPGTRRKSGKVESATAKEQVRRFMENHECRGGGS